MTGGLYEPPASSADALAEAEAALHGIVTTGGVRSVWYQDGRKVEYGPTNVAQLRAYIARLRGGRSSTVLVSTSKGL